MTTLEQILIDYPDESFYIADGFDDAIIGFDENAVRLVYDIDVIIDILIEEGMTYEDAREHYDYNIAGGYIGEGTPIFVKKYV
jgi:hypothetical protein